MKKVLVIFYSLTGTSRSVAKLLCAQQNWPMAEITQVHRRTGGWGNLLCIVDSMLHLRPPIRYLGPHPADFDAVVLISPIWLMRLASPMRSFLADHRKRLPEVAVVSVMGGTGVPDAAEEVGRWIGRPPAWSTTVTAREVEDGSCAERMQVFAAALATADSQEIAQPDVLPLSAPRSLA
ncbi:flavodoxin [Variovorax rhizosphaerae]|uniref:Flavodoxin n=1 Tax=Variovorax rhizosphaerae TaxID=1836200 RepID=A0ABU8WV09_9BURK